MKKQKAEVVAVFLTTGDIIPQSIVIDGKLHYIRRILNHFINDEFIYEVSCNNKRYTLVFNGREWYIDENNWMDYIGLKTNRNS